MGATDLTYVNARTERRGPAPEPPGARDLCGQRVRAGGEKVQLVLIRAAHLTALAHTLTAGLATVDPDAGAHDGRRVVHAADGLVVEVGQVDPPGQLQLLSEGAQRVQVSGGTLTAGLHVCLSAAVLENKGTDHPNVGTKPRIWRLGQGHLHPLRQPLRVDGQLIQQRRRRVRSCLGVLQLAAVHPDLLLRSGFCRCAPCGHGGHGRHTAVRNRGGRSEEYAVVTPFGRRRGI